MVPRTPLNIKIKIIKSKNNISFNVPPYHIEARNEDKEIKLLAECYILTFRALGKFKEIIKNG